VGLITWEVWKERNAKLFRGEAEQDERMIQEIEAIGEFWILAGAKDLLFSSRVIH
jgi:hypothetical protein